MLKKVKQFKKQGVKQVALKVNADDLKGPCGMKTVFVSASPVLVSEVQKFYQKLKDTLVTHLEKGAVET